VHVARHQGIKLLHLASFLLKGVSSVLNGVLMRARPAALCAGLLVLATICGLAQTVFNTNVRVGYRGGDNWEPGMLADNYGHLYVVFYQEPDSPVSCSGCLNHMLVQRSDDGGKTWTFPVMPDPIPTNQQADPWLQLDPDGKTIWLSYFTGTSKIQIEVVKSSDHGVNWSTPVSLNGAPRPKLDKPVSAIRAGTSAGDVYLACYDDYSHLYAAVSYNGWASWNKFTVYTTPFSNETQFLCSGAGVDSKGNLYVASDWDASTTPPTIVRVDKSSDGGKTWTKIFSQGGPQPYPCKNCGAGAYFAPQINLGVGPDDAIYILWNNALTMTNDAPNRIYFSSSTDDGATWSTPQDVSLAPSGVEHSFPSVLAGPTSGDVRIAWQDNRNSGYWNTMYRSSTNGGASFSAESFVSKNVPGYSYLTTSGYLFPYGDQLRMTIDESGKIHMAWGEAPAYTSIGNTWVANQR